MITSGIMSSDSTERETPQDLFNDLNSTYHFTLDVCASEDNAKCVRYFNKEINGLSQSWKNEVCFMNPPYGSEIVLWVKKAYNESKNGAIVVALLPARTDTKWFHDYVYGKARIHFIKGRLKFLSWYDKATTLKGLDPIGTSAPFPSMIVMFGSPL